MKQKLVKRNIFSNIILVLGYYVRYVPLLFFGEIFFTTFVSAIWAIQGPVTTKYILDALAERRPLKEIILFLAGVTLLVTLRHIIACYIVEYLENVANITMQEKMLQKIYEKASALDLEYYETPQFYTDYVWAAQQATSQFSKIFYSFVVLVARVTEMLFMGGVMIVLDPVLLLFAVAMAVIQFAARRRNIKLRYEASMEAKPLERERDYAKRVFYLSDYAKEIRLSDMHEVIHDKFTAANDRLCGIWKKSGHKQFGVALASDFGTEVCSTLGMFSYLAYEVMEKGVLTIGDFSALSQSAMRFSNRMRQMLNVVLDFSEESMYVDKFRRFMAYEPKIERQKGAVPEKELKPLVFRNVSFTYHGETKPSLKNINLVINPHEKVAIVGYNGAGKTTLIKLLMRLYDPSEGEILLGDVNIKEYDTQAYRKEFAAVFQDYQIFAATLGENVVMDNMADSDGENVEKALAHSGFGERMQGMPLGLDTPLTREFVETGINLSGGEAQKVAIARAFFRAPRFAVMDEPSSALDPVAEYKLNQNMVEIAHDSTVIFISHRLSTTVMADRIYMFEKGEIIEQGSHAELMALDGKYAEMFKKQSEFYTQEQH